VRGLKIRGAGGEEGPEKKKQGPAVLFAKDVLRRSQNSDQSKTRLAATEGGEG